MMNKQDIRKAIRQLKNLITPQIAEEAEQIVATKIEATEIFKNSSNILMYYSLPDELPTVSMIKKWDNIKKNIYLPRVNGDVLEILQFDNHLLKRGAYNIFEPSGGNIVTDFSMIELAIIPGMAFDRELNRLGRGKGYYDRFLSQYNGDKIGICYDFQIIDKIPTECYDIKMDAIMSPNVTIFQNK